MFCRPYGAEDGVGIGYRGFTPTAKFFRPDGAMDNGRFGGHKCPPAGRSQKGCRAWNARAMDEGERTKHTGRRRRRDGIAGNRRKRNGVKEKMALLKETKNSLLKKRRKKGHPMGTPFDVDAAGL